MPALFLTEHDVKLLIDVPAAIDAVEEAFRHWHLADNVPRVRAKGAGIVLHAMSAAAEYLGVVGWKCYTTTKTGARFLVGLADGATGALLALIEADHLGKLRTGAATAVAAEWMAEPDAHEVGLFGAGFQAAGQLASIVRARAIRRALVYSRTASKRDEFCQRMSRELGIEVRPVDDPRQAAQDLPIVITATTARQPVLDGNWLAEGAFVAAVGSNWLNRAELDAHAIGRGNPIVCDSVEACRREAGDFVDALEKGVFDWSRAVNLADVVAGRAAGRPRGQDGIRLFKSVGLALQDVALAAKVYQQARAQRVGVELPF